MEEGCFRVEDIVEFSTSLRDIVLRPSARPTLGDCSDQARRELELL